MGVIVVELDFVVGINDSKSFIKQVVKNLLDSNRMSIERESNEDSDFAWEVDY